jgi:hypothetical protein
MIVQKNSVTSWKPSRKKKSADKNYWKERKELIGLKINPFLPIIGLEK